MFKGVLASVLASVMFGVMYGMAPGLAPLDGEQIFGWRVVVTLPFTTALLWWLKEQGQLAAIAQRVRAQPAFALLLLASSALLGVQLWLFMWAPLHGKALPVSLGYFLLPLTLVLAGRVLFHERLSRSTAAGNNAGQPGRALGSFARGRPGMGDLDRLPGLPGVLRLAPQDGH